MRARNMQELTDELKSSYPGVVIYGIGDAAHKLEVSGHNEDDTPGVRAELSDADTIPEHRAIDIMIGPKFTKTAADVLVQNLVRDPNSRSRLYYIIWNGFIYSRSNGWVKTSHTSDPHTDHIHISGWADDDDDTRHWPVGTDGPSAPPPPPVPPKPTLHRPWPSYMGHNHYFGLITGPNSSHGGYYASERGDVKAIQQRLIALGFVPGITNVNSGWSDGKFEGPTKDAVTRWQHAKYASTTSRPGEVWQDDWNHLFTY